MKYILLIYQAESMWEKYSDEKKGKIMAGYKAFSESLVQNKQFIAGEALQPVAVSSTVTVRDGKTLVTDGPFAETREQLGGFYLVEADDADAAMEMASRIPTAAEGRVEVRPAVVWDEPGH